jgi:c-di-GMP-binding flagellar brake protein YcgR
MIEARRTDNPFGAAATSTVRRRSTRYRADIRVRIALATPVPVILSARSADLSTGGMSVILPQEGSTGAIAMIGIRPPGFDDHVWIRVRLCHRSGFRYGFQFLETTPAQRTFLRRICGSLPD